MTKICQYCNNEMIQDNQDTANKLDYEKSQKILNTFLNREQDKLEVTNFECTTCGITESHILF